MRHAKRKEYPILENITIIDAGAEGKSVAKHENMVLFIDNAVPGDVVNLKITHKKKNFAEAKAIKFHEYSKDRTEAFCEHFGLCGGCKWQHMHYEKQLFYKYKQVVDNFNHLGKFEFPTVDPVKGSTNQKYYRNKLEFTFTNLRWLDDKDNELKLSGHEFVDEELRACGFHIPKRFDKVFDVKNCYLQEDKSNAIRLFIKEYGEKNNLSFYNLKKQEGFLRTLIIRNTSLGEWMVILTVGQNSTDELNTLLESVKENFPFITSLLYVVNTKRNDTIADQDIKLFSGKDHIIEKLGDLQFKISPKSFFQTNTAQAEVLYDVAKDFAGLTGNELVYDLYTGTGTIANYVAKNAKKVIGVEYVEAAIEDAKINSQLNIITNTDFFAGDMKDVLNDTFIATHGKPDVIITDPPRAGMHQDVVNKLLELKAPKIVYVSCNPATQARDLTSLCELYNVVKVQPVDMFPHTHHIENVVLLQLKK